MSNLKLKKLQVGQDATATNNFTIMQPATPDGSLIIGRNQADGSVVEVVRIRPDGGLKFNTPNCKAANNAATSLAGGATTKVNLQSKVFDPTGAFDTATSRFNPKVAGYYLVSGSVRADIANNSVLSCSLYKNGVHIQEGSFVGGPTQNQDRSVLTDLVYMNGTTDYLELWAFTGVAGSTATTGSYLFATLQEAA